MVIIKEEWYFLFDRMWIENIVVSAHPDRDYFDDEKIRNLSLMANTNGQ